VLALTLAVEAPVVLLCLRSSPWKRVLAALLVANLLSHPALHFLLPRLISMQQVGVFILVGEGAVFVLEALVYLLVVRPRTAALAVAAAAGANAASYLVGLLLFPTP